MSFWKLVRKPSKIVQMARTSKLAMCKRLQVANGYIFSHLDVGLLCTSHTMCWYDTVILVLTSIKLVWYPRMRCGLCTSSLPTGTDKFLTP